jgi:hypothetical protein
VTLHHVRRRSLQVPGIHLIDDGAVLARVEEEAPQTVNLLLRKGHLYRIKGRLNYSRYVSFEQVLDLLLGHRLLEALTG